MNNKSHIIFVPNKYRWMVGEIWDHVVDAGKTITACYPLDDGQWYEQHQYEGLCDYFSTPDNVAYRISRLSVGKRRDDFIVVSERSNEVSSKLDAGSISAYLVGGWNTQETRGRIRRVLRELLHAPKVRLAVVYHDEFGDLASGLFDRLKARGAYVVAYLKQLDGRWKEVRSAQPWNTRYYDHDRGFDVADAVLTAHEHMFSGIQIVNEDGTVKLDQRGRGSPPAFYAFSDVPEHERAGLIRRAAESLIASQQEQKS